MFGNVCLSVWVCVMLCTTSMVQDYVVHHRLALGTTNLHCAPWCTRGTYVREKYTTNLQERSASNGQAAKQPLNKSDLESSIESPQALAEQWPSKSAECSMGLYR